MILRFSKRRLKMILGALVVFMLLPFAVALGADCPPTGAAGQNTDATVIRLQVPLGQIQCVSNLGEFLQKVYQLSISIVGIVAIIMIMIAGVKWITAAGSDRVNEAKSEMLAAIFGMFILIFAYTILNIINPQLTVIGIKPAKIELPSKGSCTDPKKVCSITTKSFCQLPSVFVEKGICIDAGKGACINNTDQVCIDNVSVAGCSNAGRTPYEGKSCAQVVSGDKPTFPPKEFCCVSAFLACDVISIPRTGQTQDDDLAFSSAQARCRLTGGNPLNGSTETNVQCTRVDIISGVWACL